MEFFARRGVYPPAGLFSAGHFIMFCCCLVALFALCYLTMKKKIEKPYIVIRITGVIVLVLEIAKTYWGLSAGRYKDWYEYLPIWFCSLFILFSLLAGFGKGKVRQLGLVFLYYGGLIGGCTYLVSPTTSLGRYPFWHFITFHSMLYHTLMIFVSIYVIYYKLIEPSLKDMKSYVWIVIVTCALAYVVNENMGTNYMFLAKPANNNALLQFALSITGPLYPVALTLVQAFGSFFFALALYQIYKKIAKKRTINK